MQLFATWKALPAIETEKRWSPVGTVSGAWLAFLVTISERKFSTPVFDVPPCHGEGDFFGTKLCKARGEGEGTPK